jgi:hypothetical protein
MKTSTKIVVAILIILAIILVFGFIGSSQAAKVGITCDFGIGEDGSFLCWKWHKNVIGQIGDNIQDMFK